MGKVHVFNAGPCLLPQVVYDNAIEAIKDFKGTGVSVLSISHRTPGWDETMDECRALWRELLHIPDTHEVVLLGGDYDADDMAADIGTIGYEVVCNIGKRVPRVYTGQ